MPTGYTADVQTGELTEFADFAMRCARGFLNQMREVAAGEPIPDEIQPSPYCQTAMIAAQQDLENLTSMTLDDRTAAAEAFNREAGEEWDRRKVENAAQRARYVKMLESVGAWTPPTDKHKNLKSFMHNQLLESIRVDCHDAYGKRPEPISVGQWYAKALARAARNVEYYSGEFAKDVERARESTKWVDELRASL